MHVLQHIPYSQNTTTLDRRSTLHTWDKLWTGASFARGMDTQMVGSLLLPDACALKAGLYCSTDRAINSVEIHRVLATRCGFSGLEAGSVSGARLRP